MSVAKKKQSRRALLIGAPAINLSTWGFRQGDVEFHIAFCAADFVFLETSETEIWHLLLR